MCARDWWLNSTGWCVVGARCTCSCRCAMATCDDVPSLLSCSLGDTHVHTQMRNTKEGPGTGLYFNPPLLTDWENFRRKGPYKGDTLCAPSGRCCYEVSPAHSWIENTSSRFHTAQFQSFPDRVWCGTFQKHRDSTLNSWKDPSLSIIILDVSSDFGQLNSPP